MSYKNLDAAFEDYAQAAEVLSQCGISAEEACKNMQDWWDSLPEEVKVFYAIFAVMEGGPKGVEAGTQLVSMQIENKRISRIERWVKRIKRRILGERK